MRLIFQYSALTSSPSLGSGEPNKAGKSSNNMEVLLLYCCQNNKYIKNDTVHTLSRKMLRNHNYRGSKATSQSSKITYSIDIGMCGGGHQYAAEKHHKDTPMSSHTPLAKVNHPWLFTVALNC